MRVQWPIAGTSGRFYSDAIERIDFHICFIVLIVNSLVKSAYSRVNIASILKNIALPPIYGKGALICAIFSTYWAIQAAAQGNAIPHISKTGLDKIQSPLDHLGI